MGHITDVSSPPAYSDDSIHRKPHLEEVHYCMEDRLPRKLTAILYADVAGYSRLTGNDEDLTHRMLRGHLDLISTTVESHRGQVMHYAGDAVLAKFDAVVDDISTNGLDFPILVRPIKHKKYKYEIVDGEHRFRACQDLGWTKAPFIVRKLTDKEAKILAIRRNNERGSWNSQEYHTWIEEALEGVTTDTDLFADLEKMGLTQEDLEDLEVLNDKDFKVLDNISGTGAIEKLTTSEDHWNKFEAFLTDDQHAVVSDAMKLAEKHAGEMRNSAGNALELICANFLADPNFTSPPEKVANVTKKPKKKRRLSRVRSK